MRSPHGGMMATYYGALMMSIRTTPHAIMRAPSSGALMMERYEFFQTCLLVFLFTCLLVCIQVIK